MDLNQWKGSSRFLCSVVLGLLAVISPKLNAAEAVLETSRPDLTGVVGNQQGQPLSNATVFIYTARPKEGVGILCPSCYADCRKQATTDAQGQFKIEGLDPTLLFKVLVVAGGHQPEFVTTVNPASGPIEVKLAPGVTEVSPDRQMKGHVVDTDGDPISGAVVSIRSVSRGHGTRFGGNDDDVDQVAVTDDKGRFVINSETPFDAAGVEVEARGFAKGVFQRLSTGGKMNALELTEGAAVKGQLVRDGEPVANAEIGICGADRNAEVYVGDFSGGTDAEGYFLIPNLPPNRSYFLYAKMNSLDGGGAVAAKPVRITGDGTTLDAGDLPVIKGFELSGQIRLADGQPVPAKTRLLLSRDEAWDSTQTEADAQGHFTFTGVPPESITLSARIKGYRLTPNNKSLDVLNPYSLVGRLRADKTDLVVEFEPGEIERGSSGSYVDLRQEPLLGVEAVTNHDGDLHVTGTVVDAENGDAIKAFTVTEGRADPFPGRFQWLRTRQTKGTNGVLDVFLTRGARGSAIQVEAEGYLPHASGEITSGQTNLTIALQRGIDTKGVVLKPDGTPASGVKVYLTDMQNGVYVQDPDMKVRDEIYRGTRITLTDEEGEFKFKPTVEDYAVLVLEDEGFAQVTVDELKANPEIRLQPWARVEGTLMIGDKPGGNESVQLWPAQVPYQYYPRHFPPLQLHLSTQTDANGHFSFDRVPPIAVQVYHSPNVKDSAMGTTPMSQTTSIDLEPGEVKMLTIGGQGRPVTGRLVVKGYDGEINWRSDVYNLELILPPTDALPDVLAMGREKSAEIQAAETDEEKQRLYGELKKAREEGMAGQREFYRTQEGRDYHFQSKRYALNCAEDGSFRVEDVPGGTYRLRIDLREGGGGVMNFSAPSIASLVKELTIPDSPGGRTNEPFDVGTIEMQARTILKAGSPAPDFEVKTVDDETVRLSDFAGKYVLLDFWAVWCGPCVGETPNLKATYDAFKDDPRFRMIGLSLDPNVKTPRDYAEKNDLGWIMGFLGEWSKTDLPSRYGVDGIPSIFLIGPDGKIVATGLRGENIKSTVARLLEK